MRASHSGDDVPRAHRLYGREIPEIVEGLRLRLKGLREKREEPESAEIAFRTICRLNETSVGRPKYPERALRTESLI